MGPADPAGALTKYAGLAGLVAPRRSPLALSYRRPDGLADDHAGDHAERDRGASRIAAGHVQHEEADNRAAEHRQRCRAHAPSATGPESHAPMVLIEKTAAARARRHLYQLKLGVVHPFSLAVSHRSASVRSRKTSIVAVVDRPSTAYVHSLALHMKHHFRPKRRHEP